LARPARTAAILLAAFAGAAAIVAAPSTALADRFDTRRDNDRHDVRRDDDRRDGRRDRHHDHDDRRAGGHVGIRIGALSPPPVICPPPPRVVEERVWIDPVYRTVCDRVWVEPVYCTVIDRVWIEPVVRAIPDRKWVPDRHEWREVVHYDRHGHRCTSREYVLVERAHFIDCTRDVILTPGRWEERPHQELVCAGRWEMVDRQELVSPGHWETRLVETCPRPAPAPRGSYARIDLRVPIGR
jgi:hypothetical protein